MITAFIFFAHLLFALIIFTKKWQDEGLKDAIINLGLIGLLFAIGWSLSGIIAKLLMEPEGFGVYFDRDTFSLALLSIGEVFFYRLYYNDSPNVNDMEKQ